jgi:hypothetical protein
MLPQLAVNQGEQFRTSKASGDSMDKWLNFYKKINRNTYPILDQYVISITIRVSYSVTT